MQHTTLNTILYMIMEGPDSAKVYPIDSGLKAPDMVLS